MATTTQELNCECLALLCLNYFSLDSCTQLEDTMPWQPGKSGLPSLITGWEGKVRYSVSLGQQTGEGFLFSSKKTLCQNTKS